MKHKIAFYIAAAFFTFSTVSCSDDDEATCTSDDDICEVVVTVCCTSETDCTYLVGDTEYATLDAAVQSADCTTGRAPDDIGAVVAGFEALTIETQANL